MPKSCCEHWNRKQKQSCVHSSFLKGKSDKRTREIVEGHLPWVKYLLGIVPVIYQRLPVTMELLWTQLIWGCLWAWDETWDAMLLRLIEVLVNVYVNCRRFSYCKWKKKWKYLSSWFYFIDTCKSYEAILFPNCHCSSLSPAKGSRGVMVFTAPSVLWNTSWR